MGRYLWQILLEKFSLQLIQRIEYTTRDIPPQNTKYTNIYDNKELIFPSEKWKESAKIVHVPEEWVQIIKLEKILSRILKQKREASMPMHTIAFQVSAALFA